MLAMHASIVDEDGAIETSSGKLRRAVRCRAVTRPAATGAVPEAMLVAYRQT